jgi:cytochrome c oxidase subunit 2
VTPGAPAAIPGAAAGSQIDASKNLGQTRSNAGPTVPSAGRPGVGVPGGQDTTQAATAPQVAQAGFVAYAREQLPAHTIPRTPIPAKLKFDDSLLGKGDVANGAKLAAGAGGCLACHMIKGNPMMVGTVGPNLTHVASRTTIAAGLFPNDPQHLARWIKNAREMKPGVLMNTFGAGEYDPVFKTTVKPGLTDQQIADIVAYLQTLK